jgi:hypothetical protein
VILPLKVNLACRLSRLLIVQPMPIPKQFALMYRSPFENHRRRAGLKLAPKDLERLPEPERDRHKAAPDLGRAGYCRMGAAASVRGVD